MQLFPRSAATTVVALGLLGSACGSDDGGDSEPAGSGGAGAGGAAGAAGAAGAPAIEGQLEPPENGFQITSGPIELEPGYEDTRCLYFDLPSDEPVDIVRFEQKNRGFSHHFVVHRAGEVFPPGLGDCPDGLHTVHPPLYPGTRDQAPFSMPDGVAMQFPERAGMVVQIHLLNTMPDVETELFELNLHVGDPAVEYEPAGVVGGSDFDFRIPPRTEHTASQQCSILREIQLFALTSHSHALTKSFDISVVDSGQTTPVYTSTDWDSPAVIEYDPPLTVPGGGGFEFSCTWQNDSDDEIRYGPKAVDEMCIFFGYYFPSTGGISPCIGF